MRPVRRGAELMGGGAAVAGAHVHPAAGLWRTPTPYLFLGFTVMLVLIGAALIVLLCSRRKPGRRGSGDAEAAARVLVPLDREPKLVVIMAGDDAPSFLAMAKPLDLPVQAPKADADAAAAAS